MFYNDKLIIVVYLVIVNTVTKLSHLYNDKLHRWKDCL